MNIRAGEILVSHDGKYYRVLEVDEYSVSLKRVDGQTIFSCRPQYVAQAFTTASSSSQSW